MLDVRVDEGQRRDTAVMKVGMDERGGDEHRRETLHNRSDT